jgi:hypothetical protein
LSWCLMWHHCSQGHMFGSGFLGCFSFKWKWAGNMDFHNTSKLAFYFYIFPQMFYSMESKMWHRRPILSHNPIQSIRHGFALVFVNYKKGALDSQPHVIIFTCCLPMVSGSLRVLQLLPPLKLAEILLKVALNTKNQSIYRTSNLKKFQIFWHILVKRLFELLSNKKIELYIYTRTSNLKKFQIFWHILVKRLFELLSNKKIELSITPLMRLTLKEYYDNFNIIEVWKLNHCF